MDLVYIFFDELISVLDFELEVQVLWVFQQLVNDGDFLIVVIYNMEFVCWVVDKIVFVEDGWVDFIGLVDDFFNYLMLWIKEFLVVMEFQGEGDRNF